MLVDTLWRQAALVAVIGIVVALAVQRATRPVRRLSEHLRTRAEGDLSPIAADDAPQELLPLVDATNQVMSRLAHLLDHQKRFVRDASHQLRTPLAVLKTQVQSALRQDVEPAQALQEIGSTVDRATRLANQMLALAKVEQVQAQDPMQPIALADVVTEVALDLAPLIAARGIDFELDGQPATVVGHDWMLREMTRNLLSNAIRETPQGGRLALRVGIEAGRPVLRVSDSGPGLRSDPQALFEPFHTGHPTEGSGLGLTICRSICDALGARLELRNRDEAGRVAGVDAEVSFRSG
jgi:two-component system sensor histidine kinase TctE